MHNLRVRCGRYSVPHLDTEVRAERGAQGRREWEGEGSHTVWAIPPCYYQAYVRPPQQKYTRTKRWCADEVKQGVPCQAGAPSAPPHHTIALWLRRLLQMLVVRQEPAVVEADAAQKEQDEAYVAKGEHGAGGASMPELFIRNGASKPLRCYRVGRWTSAAAESPSWRFVTAVNNSGYR